jgi:hypothetical protein
MDEIARGRPTTVQRALRGFDRDGNADPDGVSLARRGGWGLQSEMSAALWKQLTPHNHWVLAQILSKMGKVILGSLVTPMT